MQCYNPQKYNNIDNCPCGYCFACIQNRGNEWARRIIHESNYHTRNTFITLTYSDKFLPKNPQNYKVCLREIQNFFKRLRNNLLSSKKPARFKYFAVSDYGEKTQRLHFHVVLFNVDYRSSELRTAWSKCLSRKTRMYEPLGFIKSKPLHARNAYYIARYAVKMYGNDITVCTMSRRELIGKKQCEINKKSYFRNFVNSVKSPTGQSSVPTIKFKSYVRQYRKNPFFDLLYRKYMPLIVDKIKKLDKRTKLCYKIIAEQVAALVVLKNPRFSIRSLVEESECYLRHKLKIYLKKEAVYV